jgi:hypothetical protein
LGGAILNSFLVTLMSGRIISGFCSGGPFLFDRGAHGDVTGVKEGLGKGRSESEGGKATSKAGP